MKISRGVKIADETDVSAVCEFAREVNPDLVHVGPEAPLEAGVVEHLEKMGILCASPESGAAKIETSKEFMRGVMTKYNIRGSLRYGVFDNERDAMGFVDAIGEVAVKPIGLTGGKGVKVTGDQLRNRNDVLSYVKEVLEKGIGGHRRVLIEEKLEGEEFTLQAITDGKTLVPTPLVQDHKRLLEGDTGPNTGGMGSYSCENHLLPFVKRRDMEDALGIMRDVLLALNKEGVKFKGVLYGQFMLTRSGPKVVEFNARFADPECMNILSLLVTPLTDLLEGAATGKLSGVRARFENKATVCRYIVPRGYGLENPRSGVEISIDEGIKKTGCRVYYAAVDERDGKIYTTRSRSIAIVGIGDSLSDAEKMCSEGVQYVKGDIYYRKDIGTQELISRRIEHMKRLRGG